MIWQAVFKMMFYIFYCSSMVFLFTRPSLCLLLWLPVAVCC